jgi:hypothetical protein
MTQFMGAPIFDADQHMYEMAESLTNYLPEKYTRAVQFVQLGRHARIAINGVISDFIPNPTFERVAAPGAHEKFFAGDNSEGLTLREMQGKAIEAPAAARNPDDRIKELDKQGVAEALNYPTLASLVDHSAAEAPELTMAIIHALNQWMLEHWTYAYEDRLFSTPVINCAEVDGCSARSSTVPPIMACTNHRSTATPAPRGAMCGRRRTIPRHQSPSGGPVPGDARPHSRRVRRPSRARGLRPAGSRWRLSPDSHAPEPQSWSTSSHSSDWLP